MEKNSTVLLAVKKAIVQYLIQKKAKEQLIDSTSLTGDKLLFLFAVRDALELNFYQQTLKNIEKYHPAFDIMIFANDEMLRKLPVHHVNHHMILAKDLNFLELPKKELEIKLSNYHYKAIVNTFSGYLPILDFVASVIPSKVRLTRNEVSKLSCYNLSITYKGDINEFIEYSIAYLNKIK